MATMNVARNLVIGNVFAVRALGEGDGHLTKKGKEKYADFLNGLTN